MIPPLYKYCKFNDANYDYKNLENDTLYFSSPSSYNDPYEGVIANNIVDMFEALFAAQIMHSSENPDPILEKLKHAFLFPRVILNISNFQNEPEIQKYICAVINDILKNAKYDDVQLVAIELLYSNDYVQHFKYISNASLPVELYFTVLKKALNENARLSSEEKEYYFPILLNHYKEKHSLVNRYRRTTNLIIPIFLVDAIFNTPFRRSTYEETLKEYNDTAIETFEIIRAMPGKMFLTTCLSETPSSILMWSHYAMNHTGFCIEYDFNNLSAENRYIGEHLEKVSYADQLPSLQLASLIQVMRKKLDPAFQKDPKITEATTETCVEAILTKNSVWNYEKEWRLIFLKQDPSLPEKIPCASKIILGADISDSNKKLLLSLALKKNLPVFQAFLIPDRYAIDFYQIQ